MIIRISNSTPHKMTRKIEVTPQETTRYKAAYTPENGPLKSGFKKIKWASWSFWALGRAGCVPDTI
jgi:hypothetical protein